MVIHFLICPTDGDHGILQDFKGQQSRQKYQLHSGVQSQRPGCAMSLAGRQLPGLRPLDHSRGRGMEGEGRGGIWGFAPMALSATETSPRHPPWAWAPAGPAASCPPGHDLKSNLSQGPGDP